MRPAEEIEQLLARAGTEYSGHVTSGSLAAQMKVVMELLLEAMNEGANIVLDASPHGFTPAEKQTEPKAKTPHTKDRPRCSSLGLEID